MFERLQKKWKVNGLQLLLILCTFAIGGSLTGYTGRKLMNLLGIGPNWLWILIYIVVVTLLWPMAVLLVSIFFGQFRFFIGYLRKMGRRFSGQSGSRQSAVAVIQHPIAIRSTFNPDSYRDQHFNLAIFASGAGSNAQKIIEYFSDSQRVKIALIVCNKPGAGVLQVASRENIPVLMIDKESFFNGKAYIDELNEYHIDLIVLAGFLWKVPELLLKAYPGRIINIHPALLPNYGGKGMYGSRVHEAVIKSGDQESGISIHYVDDEYDHGATIFQARCAVLHDDTAGSLASRIHELEHEHYPRVIEEVVSKIENEYRLTEKTE